MCVDTSGKFATGVIDTSTSGKFAAGVVETGSKLKIPTWLNVSKKLAISSLSSNTNEHPPQSPFTGQ
jgi:hypothetical protein